MENLKIKGGGRMSEITYAELMEELEKYRGRPNRNRTVLDIMTEEEKKFLWACRDHETYS